MVQSFDKCNDRAGFTLIELLAVVVVLFIIFAMVLPSSGDPNRKAFLIVCMNQQRQNALGLTLWRGDHGDKFPWEVPMTNSGTMESSEAGNVAPSFQSLTNYVDSPRNFICPTDKLKVVASNKASLTESNLSYFLAMEAATNLAAAVLSGDRHLTFNTTPVKPGLVTWRVGEKVAWTRELHENSKVPRGILSFYDGHCEAKVGGSVNGAFTNQNLLIQRLVVP